jgi:2-enoate reductase
VHIYFSYEVLNVSGNFSRILEPINIGRTEIRNRVAMAPMGIVGLTNPDGTLGQRAVDYYIERARGGVGLIISGAFKVENDIENLKAGVPLVSPVAMSPFAELAEAVQALGARIFVQLTAGFGRVTRAYRLRDQPVSTSAIPYYWQPEILCRELKTEEVEKLVERFGVAAQILAQAGIDGIELHGHEGYLFDQFTTAIWNKRMDKYGGDLTGRLRFPIEVLNEIKERAGKSFTVQYRFGLKHYIKGLNMAALPGEKFTEAGRDIEEGLEMAKILEEAGFDALHVDAGCYDSSYWPHPPMYQLHGCMANMAAEVKKVVKIPVIAVGRLDKLDLAEKILEEGKADMIALARGLLADPFWVRKVEEGREEKIRPCIGCFEGCLGRISSGKPLSCAINPSVGRERTYAIQRDHKLKNVLVAGGGVAGLEAARIAALRGHQVTLYEKNNILGGYLVPGSVPAFKKDLQSLLRWYKSEVQDLGVEIRMGCEVTPNLINSEKVDVVIIAVGAKPIAPSVPGIEKKKVATAPEILLGMKQPGDRVIVVGGGMVGCETAIWLAQQGKRVTIVEMLKCLMTGSLPVPHPTREMVLDMLRFNEVTIMTSTKLVGITDDGAHLMGASAKKKNLNADTVVVSVGLKPDKELYRALIGKTSNLYLIGDARKARNIMGAIWDGYEVANNL